MLRSEYLKDPSFSEKYSHISTMHDIADTCELFLKNKTKRQGSAKNKKLQATNGFD